MADFVAVLKRTIDGLGETTPAMREKVYLKARATVNAKLAALNPPPPPAVADRQRKALEDAIAEVERSFAPKAAAMSDPIAELDALFAELSPKKPDAQQGPPAKPQAAPPPPAAAKANEARSAPPIVASQAARPSPPQTGDASLARSGAATPMPAKPAPGPSPAPAPAAPTADNDADEPDFAELEPARPKRRSRAGLVIAALLLLVVGGTSYAVWMNRDAFVALFSGDGPAVAETAPEQPAATPETADPEPEEVAAAPAEPEPEPEPQRPEEAAPPPKFTQKLNPDGTETDAGPAGGEAGVGEGTTVAAVTTPPADQPAAPATSATPSPEDPAAVPATDGGAEAEAAAPAPETAATPESVPVGQRAIFYEERTSVAEGSAEEGTIVWSLAQESPGGDAPPEAAIRAEATVPGKNLRLRMTIRRNADRTLPASHIIELIFLTPDDFSGGAIDNVLRMTMKDTEQAAGNPLLGVPAKIADGFFLVALNDGAAAIEANTTLLRRERWIDIPVVYRTGRRALITMEKGIPGDKVFDEALRAWQAATSG